MRNFNFCLFILLLPTFIFGQDLIKSRAVFMDKNVIDPNRYEGIKNDPYLFREFVKAIIYEDEGIALDEVLVNYNGYSGNFEFTNNKDIVVMDDKHYSRVELVSKNVDKSLSSKMSDTTIFIKAIYPVDDKPFHALVYNGKFVNIIKSFNVSVIENKINSVGQTISMKYFTSDFDYWIIRHRQSKPISLNKKGIMVAFDNRAEIKDYMKKNKISQIGEAELIQVARFFESL